MLNRLAIVIILMSMHGRDALTSIRRVRFPPKRNPTQEAVHHGNTRRFHHPDCSQLDEVHARKQIDRKFLSLSVYSFFQQASAPLADLVDAAFLSRLGPNSLGGVGVARASQSAVSKLYNSPLSKTSISFIASKAKAADEDGSNVVKDELSTAVTSALILGAFIGVLQLIIFTLFCNPILGAMGVQSSSAMHAPAVSYMRSRALCAPSSTLWLVSTGAFRGLGDATTPLLCALFFNIINFFLDPLFILRWKLGVSGAALATASAQTIALVPLLWFLNKRVPIRFKRRNGADFLQSLKQYIQAGAYLMGRSIARLMSVSYCTRQAALLGSVAASSYSLLYQLGFWITMLCESISIATQSLFSKALADSSANGRSLTTFIVHRSLQAGLFVSGLATLLVVLFRSQMISTLATNPDIQQSALNAFPFFLLTQLMKGITFSVNGIVLGGMHWGFAFWSMCLANAACILSLRLREMSVPGIWIAWTAYYVVQALVGGSLFRISNGTWKTRKPMGES